MSATFGIKPQRVLSVGLYMHRRPRLEPGSVARHPSMEQRIQTLHAQVYYTRVPQVL